MKRILLAIIALSCFHSYGQKDTIVDYLDQRKVNVVAKNKAHYTRLTIPKESNFQVVIYSSDGQLVSDELFSDSKLSNKIGVHKLYHPNGRLQLTKQYNDQSQLNGQFFAFFEDGSKNFGGMYKNDKRVGVWNFYYMNGNKIARLIYDQGVVKKHNLWYEDGTVKDEELIFERRPKFQKGEKDLNNYIRKHLLPKFRKSKFKGRLILHFAINKEGRPVDIKIIPNTLPQDEINSIFAFFNEMPNWEPGIQLNRPVKVKYTLPLKLK